MTTYVEARDAIVSHIDANFSGIPVFYENTLEVDLNTVEDRFIRVEVEFSGASQASMGDNALDRTYGFITYRVFTKQGRGTRATLEVMDTLRDVAKTMTTDKVQCESVRPGKVESKSGWECRDLLVPFWFDRLR